MQENEIWHKSTEEPGFAEDIAFIVDGMSYSGVYDNGCFYHAPDTDIQIQFTVDRVERWAYVRDLIVKTLVSEEIKNLAREMYRIAISEYLERLYGLNSDAFNENLEIAMSKYEEKINSIIQKQKDKQ